LVLAAGRICVSTLSMSSREDMVAVAGMGIGLELFADGDLWKEPKEILLFGREALARGVRFAGVHAPIYDLNLACERYPGVRRETLDAYRRCLEVAAALGARYTVVHPSSGRGPIFDRGEAARLAKEALAELAVRAGQLGVGLAVENVGLGKAALFDQGEYAALFGEVEGLLALLDVGHAFINGWDIPQIVGVLGEKLAALHLHDNDGREDGHLPLGEGKTEWPAVWKAVQVSAATPALVLEYRPMPVSRLIQLVEKARRDLAVLDNGAGGRAVNPDRPT